MQQRKRCRRYKQELNSVLRSMHGVKIDSFLHSDLCAIMRESSAVVIKSFPDGSFRWLFWDQQLQGAKVKDARAMRWHPCIIKWCLNLKLLSTSAYHSLRTSGFVKLPSERTLRDYTHLVESRTGFFDDLNKLLVQETQLDKLPD